MMTTNRIAVLILLVLLCCVVTLTAATTPKFVPTVTEPVIVRYLVTLADNVGAPEIAAIRQELALKYGGRLELFSSADVRQFAVAMLPARARLLSDDSLVRDVTEVAETQPAGPAETPTAPAAATIGRHLPSQALGFGDSAESYTYDGSGNITAIGSDTFRYDAEERLVHAVVRGMTADYTYDAFGNRKTASGETNCMGQSTCATTVTVETTTNHLLTTGATSVTYDAAGNITAASGGSYTYDGTGMMTEATVASDDRQFVYTAEDERIAVRQGVSWTWTVRGLDNTVLRDYTSMELNNQSGLPTQNLNWVKDYVWRDGLLLASTDATGTSHYHLDHLGTPRLITNASGAKVAEHAYYPFGAEISITPHESTEEAMKFTGHERDLVAGDGHTLDDMHARYYNASLGRFLSVDPGPVDPKTPQSWNRYSYVRNNPIDLVDPTGRADDDGPKLDNIQLVLVDPYDIFHVNSTADYREVDDIGAAIHAQNQKIQDVTVFTAKFFEEFAMWATVFMPGLGPTRAAAMESTEAGILLGENMARVTGFAEKFGLSTFKETGATFAETMANNMKWLAAQVKSGAKIFDIGLDATRGGRNVGFTAEVTFMEKAGYARQFVKLAEVEGKTYRLYQWVLP